MTKLYDALGVNKDSDKAEIKKAYRDKSQIHHPDKGGKKEDFQLISKAYKILSDDEKKQRYDNGESLEDIGAPDNGMLNIIGGLFVNIIAEIDVEQQDVISLMRSTLQRMVRDQKDQIADGAKRKKKFEKVIKRLKSKGANNMLEAIALAQISAIDGKIAKIEKEQTVNKDALKFLEDFSYEIDAGDIFRGAFFVNANL